MAHLWPSVLLDPRLQPRYMKSKRLFAFISWEVGNETDTGGCDRRNDNLEITVLGEFGLTSIDGVRNVGDL